MGKKIAISQSNYIPWQGFFDVIRQVDEFIINDGWQFNSNSWRNRNIIKTHQGFKWLTIPVRHISLTQTIAETEIHSRNWRQKHWKSISQNYCKAPYYANYKDDVESLYFSDTAGDTSLSVVNYKFLQRICAILGISTAITRITEHEKKEDKNSALIEYCKRFGATVYLALPASKTYIDSSAFAEAGIDLQWMKYDHSSLIQPHAPYAAKVSIIDTLFNSSPLF